MSGGGKNVELQPQMRVCFGTLPESFVQSQENPKEYHGEVVLEIQNEVGFLSLVPLRHSSSSVANLFMPLYYS